MSTLNGCLLNGATEAAKRFIESGVDINAKGENGIFPISSAIASENPIVLNFVISNRADVNIDLGNGWTPLHEAFDNALDGMIQNSNERPSNESLEIIDILIKNGADIDKLNSSGRTPLASLNTYSATAERFNSLKTIFREILPTVDNKITFKRNAS